MAFERLLERVGNFGRFQKAVGLFCALACIIPLMQNLVTIFSLEFHDFTCHYGNDIFLENSCSARINGTLVDCPLVVSGPNALGAFSLRDKYGLYCAMDKFGEISNFCFGLGLIMGGITSGVIADRYGRKIVGLLGTGLMITGGILGPLSPYLPLYIVLRVLVGIGIPCLYSSVFTVLFETISAEYRAAMYIITIEGWSSGVLFTALFGYLFSDFQTYELAMGLLTIPIFIGIALVPESPRWLLVMGRHEEALKALQRIQWVNGLASDGRLLTASEYEKLKEELVVQQPDEHLNEQELASANQESPERPKESTTSAPVLKDEKANPGTPLDLIRFKYIGIATVITWYTWFGVSLSYYGWSLLVGDVGGSNKSLSLCISGSMEIVGRLGVIWMAPRVGRKAFSIILLWLAAMCCLAAAVLVILGRGDSMETMFISMCGRCAISWSWDILGLIMAEFAPTPIRVLVFGSTSMFSRIGTIGAALFPIINRMYPNLPLYIIVFITFTGGVTCFFYPETRKTVLKDTMEEADEFCRLNMPFTNKKKPPTDLVMEVIE